MLKEGMLIINGWVVLTHPLFLDQLENLSIQVENLRQKDPLGYQKKNAAKRLDAIQKLIFKIIPEDPTRDSYRLGSTLGDKYKHCFRAKFFQQYRLFFRYHQDSKIVIFLWVNDEKSKRVYGAKTDAYRVFEKMLNNGYPPDDWDILITEAQSVNERLKNIADLEGF
ncbi:type II toxin-antitoxin system YhaV family toxin [Laspinema sp. D1]|uniref:Type II toxin-antitoxin system YhaV family toxin n=1 Tax=Laspinema palackyanum D2a TaxID=2953684 RepID=A0ABT2MYC0_9CYAN|nr:type II toxin-antitoxin system YhaV family toxin [Laspinema sp. D2a]